MRPKDYEVIGGDEELELAHETSPGYAGTLCPNDPSQRRKRWLLASTALFILALVVVLVGFVLVLWHYEGEDAPGTSTRNTVLLISIDGFRNAYLSRNDINMPNIRSWIRDGVVLSNGLTSCFPTKTFPNHYSIVTGLYPESHGIVSNTMYDPVFNATFRISDPKQVTDGRWWGGEPLWVTAEKQGQKAGTYFWPGSEAEIKGYRPSYYVPYKSATPYADRVSQILEWLDYGIDQRPTFLTLYFEGVDTQGHNYGPGSAEVVKAIEDVDLALGQLISGLKARQIYDSIDIVLVYAPLIQRLSGSDHGMTDLSPNRVIYLEDHINIATVKVINWGPVLMLIPNNPDDAQQLVNQLQNVHPNMTAYLKQNVPERFHYDDNRRITPVVGIADLGWTVLYKGATVIKGDHGYDPEYSDMRAIFVGHGPHFKSGVSVAESFQNIEIYNIVTSILGLSSASNNGTLASVRNLVMKA